jgi:glycosyltransferase involved in cell wall biosynthesis
MTTRCVHLIPETLQAGAELQALYLLEALAERTDYEIEIVFHAEGRLHPRFEALGVPMRKLERRRRLVLDARSRTVRLRRLFGSRPPDILHTWLYEANVVGLWAARAWPRARVVIGQRSGTMEREAPLGRRLSMRALYPRADRGLANSREGAELLADLGLEQSRIRVIPQGVPPERVELHRPAGSLRTELGIDRARPLVLNIGRPEWTKDHPGLLAAMEQVWRSRADAALVLVGPTPHEMMGLGLELDPRAMAIGWVDHPADLIAAADVVAIASSTEGNSNVANEALMLGRPVACTDTGAHPAVVRDAGGRVVPVRQPDALAAAILDLLANPPAADDVRAVANARLDVRAGIDAVLDVYDELTDDRAAVDRVAGGAAGG